MIPYTTIPFLSAFFLVVVGILIAHLLGTRSRDAARMAVAHLRSRNDDLRASLEVQTSEYVRQQQTLVAAERERDVLRSRLDQMQTLLMQREQEYRRQQRAAAESEGDPTESQAFPSDPISPESAAEPGHTAERTSRGPCRNESEEWERRYLEAQRLAEEWEQRCVQETQQKVELLQRLQKQAQLQAAMDEKTAAQTELEEQLAAMRQACQQVESELQLVRQREQKSQQHRLHLEIKVDELLQEHRGLQRQLSAVVQQRDESLRDAQKFQQEAAQEWNAAKQRQAETIATESSLREIVTQLREELDCRVERMELLQEEKELALTRAADERKQRAQLEQSLVVIRDTLEQLRSDNETLTASQRERESAADSAGRHSGAPALSICHDEPAKDSSELLSSTSGMMVSLRELQRKLHRICSRNVPEMLDHGALGHVYRTPPSEADDLKKISGIADVWEEKLNQLGVYTYQQIMEWETEAIAEVSRLLDCGDRIERDDWVGQARRLYERIHRAA